MLQKNFRKRALNSLKNDCAFGTQQEKYPFVQATFYTYHNNFCIHCMPILGL